MINPETIRVARTLIMSHEGFREKMYLDSTGHHTIGFGHCLDYLPISAKAAEIILNDDLQWFVDNLPLHLPWFSALDEARQVVMLDMAFNLGMIGLMKFKDMLDYMADKKWDAAADAMLDSRWARQVGERAHDDARIMRTGIV